MRRVSLTPRLDWQAQVERLGFAFHTLDGETYWDESVAYAFTLDEIERDIEAPTEAIEQLCFAFIERAIDDDAVFGAHVGGIHAFLEALPAAAIGEACAAVADEGDGTVACREQMFGGLARACHIIDADIGDF